MHAAAADLLPAKLGSIMYASTSSSGSLRRLQVRDRQGRAGREAGGGRAGGNQAVRRWGKVAKLSGKRKWQAAPAARTGGVRGAHLR